MSGHLIVCLTLRVGSGFFLPDSSKYYFALHSHLELFPKHLPSNPNYIVGQASDKLINVPILGKDNIEIIPLVTVDSATFQCRGIVENLDLNTLLKC